MAPTPYDRLMAHYEHVTSFLTRVLRDEWAAQDLTQETYLRAWRATSRGEQPRDERAWLGKIAYRIAVDYQRKRAADAKRDAKAKDYGVLANEYPEPGTEMQVREDLEEMQRAITALPDFERSLIEAHHLNGIPYRELVCRYYTTQNAAKSAAWRARQRLREALE